MQVLRFGIDFLVFRRPFNSDTVALALLPVDLRALGQINSRHFNSPHFVSASTLCQAAPTFPCRLRGPIHHLLSR